LPAALLLAAGATALLLGSRTQLAVVNTADFPFAQPFKEAVDPPLLTRYGHLPLLFEPNQGQSDPQVKFVARGMGYGLFLTADSAILALQHPAPNKQEGARSVVRMNLAGARGSAAPEGIDRLPGRSNYLIGNKPANWHRDIPQFARVRYRQVYPGVDLVYYGRQGQLEYDFELAPGVDPRVIQLRFEGVRTMKLDAGDLVFGTDGGDVHLQAPLVYQSDGGPRKQIAGRFALLAGNKVGFELGPYDHSKGLVIDPVLTYSTYFGGSGGSVMFPTVVVDAAAFIYVTGSTSSPNLPINGTPFQKTLASGATANAFVAKFDPTGATLVFSTYLGGDGTDATVGIAIDAAGDAYVAGTTSSSNFPTQNAFQTSPKAAGTHAFVSELDANGSTLKYSTYLSGSGTDTASAVALDNKGFVYAIGITNSTDFPTAPAAGTIQPSLLGTNAFFVVKVDPTTSGTNSLPFSTYFGGGNPTTGTVAGGAIAVDNNPSGSNIFITGGTNYLYTASNATTDFPIKNAAQSCLDSPDVTITSNTPCPTTGLPTTGGVVNMDAFVAKMTPGITSGPQVLYSTYLGGTGQDVGYGIALDASGNAYVTGSTNSPAFPMVLGGLAGAAYQKCLNSPPATTPPCPTSSANTDAFIGKINNPVTGSGTTSTSVELVYFSYIGGSGNDSGRGIVVDNIQGARIIGSTSSSDLATLNPVQSTLNGTQNAFAARLDTLGTASTSSQFVTYLGGSGTDTGTGIAVDSNTNTYLTGETNSPNFPTASPYQGTLQGTQDAFVTKLGPKVALNLTVAPPASTSINAGNQVGFVYTVTNVGDTTANVFFQDNLATGSGSAPATFVSASATGGSCPSAPTNNTIVCNLGILNGGSTATITVNLTPTGAGTLGNSGSVFVGGTFSKSATAVPVTVNSYTVSATPNQNVVVAGNPATYQVTVTPRQNFTASISLTCSQGLPGGTPAPTCTFSTTPITLQGTSPSSVALTISTYPRTTTTVRLRSGSGRFCAIFLPVAGLAFLGFGIGTRWRRKREVLGGLLFLALATLVLALPGCSGSSSSTTTTGTPAGTYTVVISATSGTFSQTTSAPLVVQ
jgi:hypothetical protein